MTISPSAEADRIVHGGRILTVDDQGTIAEAVAIKGDRILAVGTNAQIAALRGPATELVDLDGATAIPGMMDNHTHQMMAGMDGFIKVNIARARSLREIKEIVAAEARRIGPGKWISTSCMFRGALEEGRFPNRHDLDAVAPENPVYIFQSGKNVIVNSLALKMAGITRDTPDPVGNADYSEGHIVRDADGEPTGHLIAGAADMARRRWLEAADAPVKKWDFITYDGASYAEAIVRQMRLFNSFGITATRDMGLAQDEIDAYRAVADAGRASVRTDIIVGMPLRYFTTDEAEAMIDSYAGHPQGDWSDWLRIGGFKFVLQNDGFWSHHPTKFRRLIKAVNRKGWRLAIHGPAKADSAAWDDLMDVLKEADAENPLAGRGMSFEHWTGAWRPEHYQLMRDWGVAVAPNPPLSYMGAGRSVKMHQALQEVKIAKDGLTSPMDHARREWGLNIRDWIDAGLLVSGGTDCPATVYDRDRPLLGMHIARTQTSLAGTLLEGQTVTPDEALRMWTINGARSVGADHLFGSIEPGKFADITVLSHNPLEVSDDAVLDIRIEKTFAGGACVYDAQDT